MGQVKASLPAHMCHTLHLRPSGQRILTKEVKASETQLFALLSAWSIKDTASEAQVHLIPDLVKFRSLLDPNMKSRVDFYFDRLNTSSIVVKTNRSF